MLLDEVSNADGSDGAGKESRLNFPVKYCDEDRKLSSCEARGWLLLLPLRRATICLKVTVVPGSGNAS